MDWQGERNPHRDTKQTNTHHTHSESYKTVIVLCFIATLTFISSLCSLYFYSFFSSTSFIVNVADVLPAVFMFILLVVHYSYIYYCHVNKVSSNATGLRDKE